MRSSGSLCRAASMIALVSLAVCYLTVGISAYAPVDQDSITPVVFIRRDGAVELNGVRKGSLSDLNKLESALEKSLAALDKNGVTQPAARDATDACREKPVVVKADASLKYGSVVDALLVIRNAGARPIKVEVSNDPNDPYAIPPGEPCSLDTWKLRPNPLMLVVTVTSHHRLMLNGDEMGTSDDTSRLMQKLSDLFQKREAMKAFRPGTEQVEKTIYIKAARSLDFSEVRRVADAVKQAGADPTGLQIDDLPNLIK